MAQRPKWPKFAALVAFVILGAVIGFNCAGGPARFDQGFVLRVALGAVFGAVFGLILFGMVMSASRRNRNR